MKTYVIILFTLLTTFFVNSQCTQYQVYESFLSTLPTQGGTWSSTSVGAGSTVGTQRTGTYYLIFNAVGDIIRTPQIANPGVFSFYHKRSSTSSGGPQFTIETSPDNTTWTSRGTVTPGASYAQYTLDLGALSLTNVYIRVRDTRTSGTAERYIDDMAWTSTVSSNNTLIPGVSTCSQTLATSTTYTFTDAGGSSDTYNNSMSQTFTFTPGTAGQKAEINFSSLVGELGAGGTLYDYIRVYNGPTTASTLIGTYTSSPGSVITSSAAGGELTVTFTSDGSTLNAGWVATVYMVTPTCGSPSGVTMTTTSSTAANLSWTAPSPAPGSGYQWEVRTSGAGGSGSTGLTASGTTAAGIVSSSTSALTQNTTYTLYVRSDCGSSSYSPWVASTAVTTPIPEPANNLCGNAIALTVNSTPTCSVSSSGTTLGATQSLAATSGYGTADDDVWYTFMASGTKHTITVTPGTLVNAVVQVFSGTCSGLTSIGVIDATSGSSDEVVSCTGLTNGVTYYVRVYAKANGSNQGTFTICATSPPSNDEVDGAVELTVNGSENTYTNVAATSSTTAPTPTGPSYFGGDVWFKATVPSNGIIEFITTSGTLTDMVMEVYSGTPSSLTYITYNDDAISSVELMPYIYLSERTSGETIYVRMWDYSGDQSGTFKISASSPISLPVDLIYFDGVKYPTFNSLRWVTASEHNSSHFIIERSVNGNTWDAIGNKKASGNSQTKINYFYLDNYTNQFNVYYRLAQYDIDGKFKIYGPIVIQGTSTKRIVKYINTLGQEVSPTSSGVIFEVYEDGTMKKIIR